MGRFGLAREPDGFAVNHAEFLETAGAATGSCPDACVPFTSARQLDGVGRDWRRGLDQALGLEEGGEAGVAGGIEGGGA